VIVCVVCSPISAHRCSDWRTEPNEENETPRVYQELKQGREWDTKETTVQLNCDELSREHLLRVKGTVRQEPRGTNDYQREREREREGEQEDDERER
jgi:hypothetical protein